MGLEVSIAEDAASYHPWESGRYEVSAGLHKLGTGFGNSQDVNVFQIDSSFREYRDVKVQAREEDVKKYHLTHNLCEDVERVLTKFMIRRLLQEHPQNFSSLESSKQVTIYCRLTGDELYFSSKHDFLGDSKGEYVSSIDALAMQVQEDIATISRKNGKNWVSTLHVCHPNHWVPEEKIGKDFNAIHNPVAHFDKIIPASDKIVRAMVEKGPFVRFAWGLSTDRQLNHHPQPPPGEDESRWRGRSFDKDNPELYLRIERQTMCGLPEVDTALFLTRTYFEDCAQVKKQPLRVQKLISAIESMSDQALRYKGLSEGKRDILNWLGS